MAKNVIINGVTYSNVPEVAVPLSTGSGTARFLDTTISSGAATASDILTGHSAYVNGSLLNGSLSTPTISQDATTKVLTIS